VAVVTTAADGDEDDQLPARDADGGSEHSEGL